MDKTVEYRKKVRELVDYILYTNDEDVIKHYDDMMWELVKEVGREVTVKFINHLIDSDISIDLSTNTLELFDEWKSKQEDK